LTAGHPLLAAPNPIGPGDFAGWVQERGLYFAQKWDERYEAPLAMADPGEEANSGALVFARYGNGSYVTPVSRSSGNCRPACRARSACSPTCSARAGRVAEKLSSRARRAQRAERGDLDAQAGPSVSGAAGSLRLASGEPRDVSLAGLDPARRHSCIDGGAPMRSDEEPRGFEAEPPPFGGSWRRLYAIVAGALLAEIVLFALFTAAFR
jgi:hypothetical protein